MLLITVEYSRQKATHWITSVKKFCTYSYPHRRFYTWARAFQEYQDKQKCRSEFFERVSQFRTWVSVYVTDARSINHLLWFSVAFCSFLFATLVGIWFIVFIVYHFLFGVTFPRFLMYLKARCLFIVVLPLFKLERKYRSFVGYINLLKIYLFSIWSE